MLVSIIVLILSPEFAKQLEMYLAKRAEAINSLRGITIMFLFSHFCLGVEQESGHRLSIFRVS